MCLFCCRLLLPFVTREITWQCLQHFTSLNDTSANNLASFSFLYGSLPTAPVVFIFATQYAIAQAIVSALTSQCPLVTFNFVSTTTGARVRLFTDFDQCRSWNVFVSANHLRLSSNDYDEHAWQLQTCS